MLRGSSASLREAGGTNLSSEEIHEQHKAKYQVPTPAELTFMQIALATGYTIYLLTAWLNAATLHKVLFPQCTNHWMSWNFLGPYISIGCTSSILVFWTFPIFCCHVLLLFLYRDLIRERIYYVMFQHRVQIDYMNITFFRALSVRLLLVFTFLAAAMYPFTSNVTIRSFILTIPYWAPVVSFLALMYANWDLEARLMSVAKFIEEDVEWAGEHLKESIFLRDYLAEEAFHKVREELDKEKPAPAISTGEYIFRIVEKSEEMMDAFDNDADLKKWRKGLKKNASTTIFHSVSPWYWGYQFLYSPYLVDKTAKDFQFWFRIYLMWSVLLTLILLFFSASTVLTILYQQDVVPDLPFHWVDWLAFKSSDDAGSQSHQGIASLVSGLARGGVGDAHPPSFIQFMHPLHPWGPAQ
jgi:hypothetical protein